MDRAERLSPVRGAAAWIATLGPVGLWPWGPGTLASAVTAALWPLGLPVAAWAGAAAGLTMIGVIASDRAERSLGHDDGRIVIDETAGMAVALLAAPPGWTGALAALALFRFFDIAKPPPIGRLQAVPGGWGVMLDDLAAGAAAAAVLAGGRALAGA